MKEAKKCPKCLSTDIVRIPGRTTGNYINLFFGTIRVTRFLCASCGFTEEWIEDQKGIEKLRKKYQ